MGYARWAAGFLFRVTRAAAIPRLTWAPDNRHFNPTAGWVARVRGLHAQAAIRRAPPITAYPQKLGIISKPLAAFAQANTIEVSKITYVIAGRPRGRQ
ncbi:hypothetical protein [Achromobacter aegrifaciens]